MKRRLLVLACCLGAACWLASVAAACHSEITASLDCNGKISWTASAWNGSDATTSSRTNSNVAVWTTVNGQTQTATGHFGTDDNFAFSGTFSVGSATSATVYVQEKANWASGDAPANARSVTVSRPSNCSGSGGGGGTPPPVQNTPPAAPGAPAGPTSISFVKLERDGPTGDFVPGPVTAQVGDTIEYELIVTNNGPAVSLSVSDPGCTGLAPSGSQGLETGKSMTFTCTHTIVAADGTSYTNTATATATAASGSPVTASAQAVANVGSGGVLGASATVPAQKLGAPAPTKKLKPVTKLAKPARAQVKAATFTG